MRKAMIICGSISMYGLFPTSNPSNSSNTFFQVKGPKGKGTVNMHLTKRASRYDYEYKYFYVDILGHQRIYLENADASPSDKGDKQGFKLFGVKWA